MFTGIIQQKGILKDILKRKENALTFNLVCDKWEPPLEIGESIAVDGVCLTITKIEKDSFFCDILEETRKKTTLGMAKIGQSFNLERALKMGDFIGGHIVTGHIDGIGILTNIKPVGEDWEIQVKIPEELSKYIATKGSIAVDGISLTIVEAKVDSFTVHIIPHTYSFTTLGNKTIGMHVNLEIDILAKYVERILSSKIEKKTITMEDLKNAGF